MYVCLTCNTGCVRVAVLKHRKQAIYVARTFHALWRGAFFLLAIMREYTRRLNSEHYVQVDRPFL